VLVQIAAIGVVCRVLLLLLLLLLLLILLPLLLQPSLLSMLLHEGKESGLPVATLASL
jgi:hypothetical protein